MPRGDARVSPVARRRISSPGVVRAGGSEFPGGSPRGPAKSDDAGRVLSLSGRDRGGAEIERVRRSARFPGTQGSLHVSATLWIARDEGSVDPETRLLGLTLLQRAIEVGQRAGFGRIFVEG